LSSARPEMILFVAITARQQSVQQKIKNFFTKWRQVQQKVPLPEMTELHITPQMPAYPKIANDVFLLLLDGKLRSRTETLKYLKPLAPPPPPPPPPPPAKRGRGAKAAAAAAAAPGKPGPKGKGKVAPVPAIAATPVLGKTAAKGVAVKPQAPGKAATANSIEPAKSAKKAEVRAAKKSSKSAKPTKPAVKAKVKAKAKAKIKPKPKPQAKAKNKKKRK